MAPRRALKAGLISLLVACLLTAFFFLGVFSSWQTRIADDLYPRQGNVLSNIVIIAIDDASLQQIGKWPWDRAVWAQILGNIRNASAIGMDISFFEPSPSDASLQQQITDKQVILASEYLSFERWDAGLIGRDLSKPVFNARSGYVNLVADSDGVVRSIRFIGGGEKSFAAKIYEQVKGKPYAEHNGLQLIPFVGAPGLVRSLPASQLADAPMDLSGKIVLIGATARDLRDSYFVPTSSGDMMPGVEIHANILNAMLLKRTLTQQPAWSVVLLIFLLSLGAGMILSSVQLRYATLAGVFIFVGYALLGILLFERGMILNIIYPLMALILSSVAVTAFFYVDEERKKEQVLDVFGKYVSPSVAEALFKGEEYLDVRGVEREVTLLFADIRGFTSLSEKMHARDLVSMLNIYLGKLTDLVFSHQGTLDKYMGDALMALFNAPLEVKDHAYEACCAALEMQDAMVELNRMTGQSLRIGIGIHTGDVVVGNVGSDKRMDFTAIGDSVNLASRLEGLSKQYHASIIISESTHAQLSGRLKARPLDKVKVKGKKVPVRIYELRKTGFPKTWGKALALYEKGSFKQARTLFAAMNDEVAAVFAQRCDQLIKRKPKHWDGSYEFSTK